MWIFILIVLAVVVYFAVSQASSNDRASKASSRTKASKASNQNYTNQVDYSNLEIISLESSVSTHYNYTRLRDLLAEGKWREADEETGKVMLNVGNLTVQRKIQSGEYKYTSVDDERVSWASVGYFPCEDLCTIDKLWLKYSNGRFGFSVQKRIMSELGEDTLSILCDKKEAKLEEVCKLKADFLKRIKWHTTHGDGIEGDTINYNNLTFAIHAPYGHLPTANYWDEGRGGLWKTKPLNDAVLVEVLNRLSICGIAL